MTTKRKQMKNFIIDHKDKIELIQHIVEEFTDTCKGLPIYTALDNVFAGQFSLNKRIISLLWLKEEKRTEIFANEEIIRNAVCKAIRSGNYIIVIVDQSSKDLLTWYRKQISFFSSQEKTCVLSEQNTIITCVKRFLDREKPLWGMYLHANIILIEYDLYSCTDCGHPYYFPKWMYFSTSENYENNMLNKGSINHEQLEQNIMMIKQRPSVKLSITEMDDKLITQYRAHLKDALNREKVFNTYKSMAQPLITNNFDKTIPFVCPHCISKIGSIDRIKKTITVQDEQQLLPHPSLFEAFEVDLDPHFIRSTLGHHIYRTTNQ